MVPIQNLHTDEICSLPLTVTSPTIGDLSVGTLERGYVRNIPLPRVPVLLLPRVPVLLPREPRVQTLPPHLATNSTEDVSMRLKQKFETRLCNYYYNLNRDNSLESIIY